MYVDVIGIKNKRILDYQLDKLPETLIYKYFMDNLFFIPQFLLNRKIPTELYFIHSHYRCNTAFLEIKFQRLYAYI